MRSTRRTISVQQPGHAGRGEVRRQGVGLERGGDVGAGILVGHMSGLLPRGRSKCGMHLPWWTPSHPFRIPQPRSPSPHPHPPPLHRVIRAAERVCGEGRPPTTHSPLPHSPYHTFPVTSLATPFPFPSPTVVRGRAHSGMRLPRWAPSYHPFPVTSLPACNALPFPSPHPCAKSLIQQNVFVETGALLPPIPRYLTPRSHRPSLPLPPPLRRVAHTAERVCGDGRPRTTHSPSPHSRLT